MQKVIIFGINNFTETIFSYVNKDKNYEVQAFTVDGKYKTLDRFCNLPIVAFEEIEKSYNPVEYKILLCIGYHDMNDIRKKKYEEARDKGYSVMGYTHPTATILTDHIEDGNIIMERVIIGYDCIVGKCNIFNAGSMLSHNDVVGDYNFFGGQMAVAGNTQIKNNCMIGINATVKNDVVVEDYTLVGAGAYINCNTEKNSVYVPARTLKLKNKRSKDMTI